MGSAKAISIVYPRSSPPASNRMDTTRKGRQILGGTNALFALTAEHFCAGSDKPRLPGSVPFPLPTRRRTSALYRVRRAYVLPHFVHPRRNADWSRILPSPVGCFRPDRLRMIREAADGYRRPSGREISMTRASAPG